MAYKAIERVEEVLKRGEKKKNLKNICTIQALKSISKTKEGQTERLERESSCFQRQILKLSQHQVFMPKIGLKLHGTVSALWEYKCT